MVELHEIYSVLFAGVAVLAFVVVVFAWSRRPAPGAKPLAALMLGLVIWSAASAEMWHAPTLGAQVFWLKSVSLGDWILPVAFLALAFAVAGADRWPAPGRIAPISILTFLLANLAWPDPDRLFYKAYVAESVGPYTHYAFVPGPLYWVYISVTYSTIGVAFVIILGAHFRSARAERSETRILLVGALIPFAANVVSVFGSGPWGDLDLGPLAFLATGTLWLSAIVHGMLLTEREQAGERLWHASTHDKLTGLPNRFLLEDRLEHELAHVRRLGSGLAVLYLNVDHFKHYNDTLGHAHGNALLKAIADRVRQTARESDTVGRHGGDEFTLIIADTEDPAGVERMAQRVLEAIVSPYRVDEEDLHVTASIGIAVFPADGTDATTLAQHADVALSEAKDLGGNRIRLFSPRLQQDLDRRMTIEKTLWRAAEDGRYFLYYQPQVDLSTGRIRGAEALVRLHSADGTILSPEEFIPIAEDSGQVVALGDWVLRHACSDLMLLHNVDPEFTVAVNFSAREFREVDVAARLTDVLRACGVKPNSLELEITETAILGDAEGAAAKIANLRDVVGVRVSLDDFGTGYSSLAYVRLFHASTIKIDRSFVELLPDDPDARVIVTSTISLAKSLGARVVAEGPETREQVRFLRANGCDSAQGFYFSRPVRAEELIPLLRGAPLRLPDVQPVAAQPAL